MKVFLCGYHWAGCSVLMQLLRQGHEVYVFTHKSLKHIPDLAALCEKLNVPYTFENVSDAEFPFVPDVICSIYYRNIIKKNVIDLCSGKIFNLHPALLPKYRGCGSLTWAMINGEEECGYTYHYINEKVDDGKIILQKKLSIEPFDTQESLYHRVMFEALKDFGNVFEKVVEGYEGVPQQGEISLYKRGCPYNGQIDETWPDDKIERFIRAMIYPPLPAAKYDGKEVFSLDEYRWVKQESMKKKLAIVNQQASTGGWRFLYLLVKNIAKLRPDYDITMFINNIDGIEEIEKLGKLGIKIQPIEYRGTICKPFKRKTLFHIHFLDHIYNTIRKKRYKRRNKKAAFVNKNALNTLNNYDLIFYSWPYGVDAPDVSKPLFFIPHDFIFTHFFGFHSGHYYTREWWWKQRQQLAGFVQKGKAIVSSQYIKEEFIRTYPEYNKIPNVVFLSSFNDYSKKEKTEIDEKLKKLGITSKYILYANNWALHKNMQPVLGAYYYVKQKYPDIKLIITGYGTDNILCRCNSPYYVDHIVETEPYDIKSLGMLNDDDFSAVLQGAEMVVNSSLCEAGAGGSPAEAWRIGVPVVMSEIPSFKEHVEYLGCKVEFFDPRNSHDIARAILYLLDNPDIAKQNAEISQKAMEKYTWEDVARQYIDVFEGKTE